MKNTLKSVSFFVLLLVLFGFVSCKAESGDDASIPVTTQEKPTNQPQPTPQPQAGTYIVQHYQQDTTGDGYTLFETERLTGTAGEQTKAAAKTYEHFAAKTFSQAEIKADGSTVIRIDYDREIITLIFDKADESANWNDEWSGQAQDGKITIKGRYGANVAAPTIPKKTGYGTSWDKDVQTIFASNETYTAQFTEGQVNYTVEHWLENLENDEYTKQFNEDDKTGTTGSQTAAEPKSEYAEQGYEIPTVTQATISADGSTVVQIRYARKRYAVSFETNGAGTVTSQTVKHGGKATKPTLPNLAGWFYTNEGGAISLFDFDTAIASDVSLFAKYGILADSNNVAEKIAAMTESGTIVVTGEITDSTLTEIKNAIKEKNFGIGIDLGGTSGLVSIKKSAFEACSSLTSISLPSGLTSIGNHAFSDCTGLTSIELPSGVTSIGVSAFEACSSLTSISLPSGVTSIGDFAFSECSSLTSIELPSGVTSIGYSVFSECSSLTSIDLPSGVISIGEYAFSGCSGLTSINVSVDNATYSSIDGVLYSKDKTRIVVYPQGKSATSYEILESVTSIGRSAFYDCKNLTSIKLPSGVTSIGGSAFYGCSGLTSIELPSGVTSIEEDAFRGCTGLTSIELPSGVTSIGDFAFKDCSGLCSITFSGTVAQWKAIKKGGEWNFRVSATKVVCSDGEVVIR